MPALLLDGGLAGPEVRRDLLVEQARDDAGHDVPLARGQRVVPAAQLRDLPPGLAAGSIQLHRLANRLEQILLAKRLGQELDRARLHGPDRHGNVAVPGEEDDRQGRVGAGQLALQIEPAEPGEPHVEHDAARRVGSRAAQEGLGARENLDAQPHRGEQASQGLADGLVVIDHEDDGARRFHLKRTISRRASPTRSGRPAVRRVVRFSGG
jgi:hypothetical protein